MVKLLLREVINMNVNLIYVYIFVQIHIYMQRQKQRQEEKEYLVGRYNGSLTGVFIYGYN